MLTLALILILVLTCLMQLRNSKEVAKEDYNTFYKSTFKEFIDPQAYTHFSTEVCGLTRICLNSVLH